MVRWGEAGVPVLIFPTAGGDAEEIERMGLVDAVALLMADARVKVYSVDSIAGRAWMERRDPRHASWLQSQFDQTVRWEIAPMIAADCDAESIEIISAGSSIGAFTALAALCRHPDVFRAVVGMSGTFDLSPWLDGMWSDEFYFISPGHYLPNLPEGEQLQRLRQRFVLLATGSGDYENPGQSWWISNILGTKGVPNRVDIWDDYTHDWPTWRAMLPGYLDELVP